MKTIEIFAEAVKFAAEASDIPSDRILSESRDADVVDARMLVIQTLYDIGLYPRRNDTIQRAPSADCGQSESNKQSLRKQLASTAQAHSKHLL